MRLGSQPIDGAILDLTNGSGGVALTLLLSPATGSVSGIIRDDKGSPTEARVVLVRDEEAGGFPARYGTANKDGAYSFPSLGNYKLLAVSQDDADLIAPRPGGSEPDLSGYDDTVETVEIRTAESCPRTSSVRLAGEEVKYRNHGVDAGNCSQSQQFSTASQV